MRSKRYGKRIAAVFLAVILTVTLYPPAKDVRAQEAGENHTGGINVTDNTESEPEGPEKDTGAPVMPDKAKKNQNAEDQDGSQTGGGQGGGSQLQQMLIAMPVKMDEGEDIYKSLSQFLALSADQFEIYTVAFWSLSQNQAVMQAESALEVSVPFPGYDPDRTVVSEVTLNGETPVRKELPGKCENRQMIFKTDHAGVYVIMEKKILPELPASLELTAKIDKLKLEKRTGSQSSSTAYAQTSSIRLTDRESGAYTSPQTGIDDSASMLGWGIAAAAAAAAVIVLVVVIFRRRK